MTHGKKNFLIMLVVLCSLFVATGSIVTGAITASLRKSSANEGEDGEPPLQVYSSIATITSPDAPGKEGTIGTPLVFEARSTQITFTAGEGYSISKLMIADTEITTFPTGRQYDSTAITVGGSTNATNGIFWVWSPSASEGSVVELVLEDLNSALFTEESPLMILATTQANSHTVAIPASGPGYTVDFKECDGTVDHGGWYDFTLTLDAAYSKSEPQVGLTGATIAQNSVSGDGLVYTYRVTGVNADIEQSAFSVTGITQNTYSTAKPDATASFQVSTASVGTVTYDGSYTFTLTIDPQFSVDADTRKDTLLQLKSSAQTKAVLSQPVVGGTDNLEYTYTVSGVKEQLYSTDFEALTLAPNVYTIKAPTNDAYTITATTPVYGGEGTASVTHGGSFEFRLTLNPAYRHVGNENFNITLKSAKATLATVAKTNNYPSFIFQVTNIKGSLTAEDFELSALTLWDIQTAAPNAGTGYTVGAASVATVNYDGSYTFDITVEKGYSDSTPVVTISSGADSEVVLSAGTGNPNGTVTYTCTVSGVTDNLSAGLFEVTGLVKNTYSVEAPNAEENQYAINSVTKSEVTHDGSYEFVIILNSAYTQSTPVFVLANDLGTITSQKDADNHAVVTYTVSNVVGDITSADFSLSAALAKNEYTVAAPQEVSGSYTFAVVGETVKVTHGESFSFKVTVVGEHLAEPQIALTRNGTVTQGTEPNKDTYTVSGVSGAISGTDYIVSPEVLGPFTIALPANGIGYSVSNLVINENDKATGEHAGKIKFGGTFTFDLTLTASHSLSVPVVTISQGAQVQTYTRNGNILTYTVIGVTENVLASYWEIKNVKINTYSVTAPAPVTGCTITAASTSTVNYDDSYTFKVELSYSGFTTFPTITLKGGAPASLSVLSEGEVSGVMTRVYQVANVKGNIEQSHFEVTAADVQKYDVVAPSTSTGKYTSLTSSIAKVNHNGSFEFQIELNAAYSNARPAFTIKGGKGVVTLFTDATVEGKIRLTYKVTNVIGNIGVSDYEVANVNINNYLVKFNSNGGSSVNSQNVDHGSLVVTPTAPTKYGSTFAGWFTNSTLTTAYNFNTPVTGAMELWAKWTVEGRTLKFVLNGADSWTDTSMAWVLNGSVDVSVVLAYGDSIAKPSNPTRNGYNFDNWYRDAECTQVFATWTTMPNDSLTLYAKWTVNTTTLQSLVATTESEFNGYSKYYDVTYFAEVQAAITQAKGVLANPSADLVLAATNTLTSLRNNPVFNIGVLTSITTNPINPKTSKPLDKATVKRAGYADWLVALEEATKFIQEPHLVDRTILINCETALNAALNNLTLNYQTSSPTSKKQLLDLLEALEANSDDYIYDAEDAAAVATLISQLAVMFDNEYATQIQIDQLVSDALQIVEINRAKFLAQKEALTNGVDSSDWSQESWQAYQEAVNKFDQLLANGATAQELNEALAQILAAKNAKVTENPSKGLDPMAIGLINGGVAILLGSVLVFLIRSRKRGAELG